MIIGTILGVVFFFTVGYFAYTFSQCIGAFTRLNQIIPTKLFGMIGVLLISQGSDGPAFPVTTGVLLGCLVSGHSASALFS